MVAAHSSDNTLTGKTTNDVKWSLVVPETKAAACSYADLLRTRGGSGRESVGRANAFLSHVYGDPFLELVEAAAAWEARLPADAAPVFYYLDLLVVNQHGQGAAVAEAVLWREFTGSVRAIGRTLVVLSLDAAERGPLTRVWCVAEIAAGLQAEAEGGSASAASLEVIMEPRERAKFLRELTTDFAKIAQRTCTVDLEGAHAWHGDECLKNGVCRDVAAGRVAACGNDRALVLAHVRREVSFEAVNQRVIERMREFMVGEARAALAAMVDGALTLAHLKRTYGRTPLRCATLHRDASHCAALRCAWPEHGRARAAHTAVSLATKSPAGRSHAVASPHTNHTSPVAASLTRIQPRPPPATACAAAGAVGAVVDVVVAAAAAAAAAASGVAVAVVVTVVLLDDVAAYKK